MKPSKRLTVKPEFAQEAEWWTALEHLEESRPNLLRELLRNPNELAKLLDQRTKRFLLACGRLEESGLTDENQIREIAASQTLTPVEDLDREEEWLTDDEERQVRSFRASVERMLETTTA